jgi:predicted PurR-regulated permease PerM
MNESDRAAKGLVFYRRVFTLAVVAVLALLLYRIVEVFLSPLAWAVVLAFVMYPAQERLSRRFGRRPALAAALLTGLIFIVFVGPLSLLGGAFAAQALRLVQGLQKVVADLKIARLEDLSTLPAVQHAMLWIEQNLSISAEQVREWLAALAERSLEPLATLGGQAFFGAIGTVVNFTLMLFLLFYLLRDGAAILEATLGLVPVAGHRKTALVTHIREVTRAVVFGTLVTAIVQGVSVAIGFAVLGLPSPVVFGALAAILSVVPLGGTAFVWGPAALWLLLTGRGVAALLLFLWGVLIVGLADNLLRPLLISGRTEVPTLAVFIGVLGGLAAFGLVGMVLGPLLISLAVVLVRFADETLSSR